MVKMKSSFKGSHLNSYVLSACGQDKKFIGIIFVGGIFCW